MKEIPTCDKCTFNKQSTLEATTGPKPKRHFLALSREQFQGNDNAHALQYLFVAIFDLTMTFHDYFEMWEVTLCLSMQIRKIVYKMQLNLRLTSFDWAEEIGDGYACAAKNCEAKVCCHSLKVTDRKCFTFTVALNLPLQMRIEGHHVYRVGGGNRMAWPEDGGGTDMCVNTSQTLKEKQSTLQITSIKMVLLCTKC